MTLLIIIVIVSYIILFFYKYNILYIKDAWNSLFNINTEARLANALQTWSNDVKTDINNTIFGTEQNWISQNCSCPGNNTTSEENILPPYSYSQGNAPQAGYFYYDGSAPPQLLVPQPNTINSQNYENINWVDNSVNGINYYNNVYNNPENQLQNSLYNSNLFVNNETTTINM
jgi:hypothetical protein